MTRKTWLFVFSLALAIFCLQGTAIGAARWMETDEFGDADERTFVWEDGTKVYAEPNLQAKIVGELKKSSDEVWDVHIVQVRILWGGEEIQEAWGRIFSPIEGWVEWEKLGIANSGFIGELLEVPGDFKEIKP